MSDGAEDIDNERRWSAASSASAWSESEDPIWSQRSSFNASEPEPASPGTPPPMGPWGERNARLRQTAQRAVANRWFDRVILLFIMINCVFLCMDDIYLVYGSELWQVLPPLPPPTPPGSPGPRAARNGLMHPGGGAGGADAPVRAEAREQPAEQAGGEHPQRLRPCR